jgi:hypothetical protein
MLSLTSVPHDVRENKVNRVLFAHSGTSNFLTFLYLYSFLEPTLNSHLLNHDADHKDLCTTIAIALTMGRKNLLRDTAQRDEALEPKQKPIRLPMHWEEDEDSELQSVYAEEQPEYQYTREELAPYKPKPKLYQSKQRVRKLVRAPSLCSL